MKFRFFVTSLFIPFALSLQAAVLDVGSGFSYTSIASGIQAASNGDTLIIHDGLYLESEIIVDKNLSIEAKNIGGAIIDGGGADFIFQGTQENSSFKGLHLKNATQGIFQADAGVQIDLERMIFDEMSYYAVGFENTISPTGHFNISHSVVFKTPLALKSFFGGSIHVDNSIFYNMFQPFNLDPSSTLTVEHLILYDFQMSRTGGQALANDPWFIYADPLFVDPFNGDFRLSALSPGIDSGINYGQAYQGLAPDRGVFETSAVPEPRLSILLIFGLIGLAFNKQFRRK